MASQTDMPKAERVIRIFTLLIRNRGKRFSCKDIQEFIGNYDQVSLRNIQRDLQLLSELDETCITSFYEGNTPFYTIQPDYKNTVSLPLGENSLLAFFVMERLQPFFKNKEKAFYELKEKIISGGKRDLSDLFFDVEDHLESSTHIFEESSRLSINDKTFTNLLESLALRKELLISYFGANYKKIKELVIQPVKLVLFKNDLFFACKPQKKGYSAMIIKLCRIKDAKFTGKNFSITKKISKDIGEQLSRNISIFDDSDCKPQDIEINFPSKFKYIMQEKKYHTTQSIIENSDGSIIVKMHVSPDDFMVQWILQWGAAATVIKPKSLIKRLKKTGEELIKKYEV